MLESLVASLLISTADYSYLTPGKKVAVERKISDKRTMADPQISPREITAILGIEPRCGKKPSIGQIQCTWAERDREIIAYWSEPWKFQRWESKGF